MNALVVEVDALPFGQQVVWHPDLNIVTVVRGLCPAVRDAKLDELQQDWRRSLRSVPDVA